ncbi:MAG: DMT family transporter [Alphaproteobacteria bacterium]|nr:DMT family transporter [Alphaproteobacteria bacterium]
MSDTSPRKMGQHLAGMLCMLGAVSILSIMDAIVKWLASGYPTMQIVFFRNAFAFLPTILYLIASGLALRDLRTRRIGGHFMRAALGVGAMITFFYALGHMPLADVIAIAFAAPIFMTALSIPLLGEKVGPHRWAAVIAGFAGVLVMVRPGASGFDWVALIALASVVLYALAMIQIRVLSRTESSASIVFYLALFGTLFSAAFLPSQWVTPDPTGWVLLILVGLLGGSGQILLTQAFRLAPVALVAPFDYSAMIWAVGLGWLLWADVPALTTLVGAALVAAAGLYIMQREARQERLAAAQPLKRST